MGTTKHSKRPRPRAKSQQGKKVAELKVQGQINASHINTYGHWVSEMSRIIREDKGRR